MSNIGKKLIKIDEGITVNLDGSRLVVVGPRGTLNVKVPYGISVNVTDGFAQVTKNSESKDLEKYWGLIRAMLSNMVIGVSHGFEKKLEVSGVGYRARLDGRDLVLNVGYTLPVKIVPPDDISVQVVEGGVIVVSGIDKQHVGDLAAKIRSARPPDVYKGKGIRYVGEHVRRKAGKAAKAAGAK